MANTGGSASLPEYAPPVALAQNGEPAAEAFQLSQTLLGGLHFWLTARLESGWMRAYVSRGDVRSSVSIPAADANTGWSTRQVLGSD